MFDKVVECLRNIGVMIDSIDLDTDISDMIDNSIAFISFIVELEEAFEIQIRDEFLDFLYFRTPACVIDTVSRQIELDGEK